MLDVFSQFSSYHLSKFSDKIPQWSPKDADLKTQKAYSDRVNGCCFIAQDAWWSSYLCFLQVSTLFQMFLLQWMACLLYYIMLSVCCFKCLCSLKSGGFCLAQCFYHTSDEKKKKKLLKVIPTISFLCVNITSCTSIVIVLL